MKDYPGLLSKLKDAIKSAASDQQYHRLPELDSAVRVCTAEATAACQNNEQLKVLVADQIKGLMEVYEMVARQCNERSEMYKNEARQLNRNKRGAQQYLNVVAQSR